MSKDPQTPGRERNAARPLEKDNLPGSGDAETRTGRRERRTAGPDGPDAGVVGRTFKQKP